MKEPTRAPLFACLYPGLCDVARRLGYALAIHGTVTKDLDLIAVPWNDEAVDATNLRNALMAHLGACDYATLLQRNCPWLTPENISQLVKDHDEDTGGTSKPHGRIAWNLHLYEGTKVDLSVMPRKARES